MTEFAEKSSFCSCVLSILAFLEFFGLFGHCRFRKEVPHTGIFGYFFLFGISAGPSTIGYCGYGGDGSAEAESEVGLEAFNM